jgi:hypothetical protein
VNHAIHHKSHIDNKTRMVITSTMFEPRNNDIERGGWAHKVSFTWVGVWTTAQKDSYSWVCRDDGTSYHYPKIPVNRLQKKGGKVWKNLEITGSKIEGNDNAEFFSLKTWFEEVKIPRLEALAQKQSFELGGVDVVVVMQYHGIPVGGLRTYVR